VIREVVRPRPAAGGTDDVNDRAVARDTKQRFETAEEMLLALERGGTHPVSPPQRTPLWNSHPAARWQALALVLLIINLLLLYLLLIR
jgi:hypothetical protein